jgi:hypothetical protein
MLIKPSLPFGFSKVTNGVKYNFLGSWLLAPRNLNGGLYKWNRCNIVDILGY